MNRPVRATLDQIIAETRLRVEQSKKRLPPAEIARQAERLTRPNQRFKRALEQAAKSGVAVIAELKRASPSKGVIRDNFPVGKLAAQLAKGGASALSVLTEGVYFHGSLQNLREAAAATGLPCLRKDFIIDEYQLFEAAVNSADAVLLIVAALRDPELAHLYRRASELGLDVLCEVHDERERARAVALGAEIIGVNSRNLKTLAVDPATLFRLADALPANVLRVAESGISSEQEIRALRATGYQAFLIGESLMQAEDPGAALAQLLATAKAPAPDARVSHSSADNKD